MPFFLVEPAVAVLVELLDQLPFLPHWPAGSTAGTEAGGGPIRRLMASLKPSPSSEPFFFVSASRTNFSAALAASSGLRRLSLFSSAASMICGARNVPGPKPGGGPLGRSSSPSSPPGPKPGGGPSRRLIARPSARASTEPFFSVSASRTNFSAAFEASPGESYTVLVGIGELDDPGAEEHSGSETARRPAWSSRRSSWSSRRPARVLQTRVDDSDRKYARTRSDCERSGHFSQHRGCSGNFVKRFEPRVGPSSILNASSKARRQPSRNFILCTGDRRARDHQASRSGKNSAISSS